MRRVIGLDFPPPRGTVTCGRVGHSPMIGISSSSAADSCENTASTSFADDEVAAAEHGNVGHAPSLVGDATTSSGYPQATGAPAAFVVGG